MKSMTAIQPSDSNLRDKIRIDFYNQMLTSINEKYTKMNGFVSNLESDIASVADFEAQTRADANQGFDVGTALETLTFQRESLTIDADFFKHMRTVYTKKLYGDLYLFCSEVIDAAMAIEGIPSGFTNSQVRERKFAGSTPYPPKLVENPDAKDAEGNPKEGVPTQIPDPFASYTLNDTFSLIIVVTANLRELADDINGFNAKIEAAEARQARGFSVGNLIMNLQAQQQRLTLEFTSSIARIEAFLEQNAKFSARCLNRIEMISNEIVTAEEAGEGEGEEV